MGILENMQQQLETYGGISRGKLEGQENGECSSPVVQQKYKRRKVSAVRNFPDGCGPNAPQTETIPVVSSNMLEVDEVMKAEVAVFELPMTMANEGMIDQLNHLEHESSELPKESYKVEIITPTDMAHEPSELPKDSHKVEITTPSYMVHEPSELTAVSHKVEITTPTDMVREPSEFPKDPHKVEISTSTDLIHEQSEFPKDSHELEINTPTDMVSVSGLKLCSLPTWPTTDTNVLEKIVTLKYPPRRKISAIRDFPLLCGTNAQRLSKEDCIKALASPKSLSLGHESSVVKENLMNNTGRADFKELGEGVRGEGNLKRKFEKNVSIIYGNKFKVESEGDGINEMRQQFVSGRSSKIRAELEDIMQETVGDKVKAECEGDGINKMRTQFVSGISSDIREDLEDIMQGTVRALPENDLIHLDHKSCTYGEKGDTKVREEGKVDEIFVCDKEVGGMEGEVAKEIVIYEEKLGGLEKQMGKEIVVYDMEVGYMDGKVGNEIVLHKTKSDSSGFSGRLTQIHAADVGLNLVVDRVVVQGLMAESNCPWKQGKGPFEPNRAGVMQGSNGRKHGFSKSRNAKSISRSKKVGTENLGGQSVKKKYFPTMAAYPCKNELVVSGEVDSFEHNEGHEDYFVAHRDVSLPPFGQSSSSGRGNDDDAVVTRSKVRETLRIFQVVCRKLLQEEEAKSKQGGKCVRRVDLLAAKILKSSSKYVNTGKQILGVVPGVEVGDEFNYRVELAIVGLHRPYQGGIDYLKKVGKIIATSIVASGGYADDLDNSDVLIYTGSGGNEKGRDGPPKDQKLLKGNLALKNSIHAKNPVRVIRGIERKASDSDARAKVLTYDGLYFVEKYWQEPGEMGNLFYKFQLVRMPGQAALAWNEVKKSKKFKLREGLCVNDISQGTEVIPICAINTLDDEKPPQFRYVTSIVYPKWCNPLPPRGCDCTDGCSNSERCSCAIKNGEIPYNYNGAIVEAKPLVYECGPSCKCPQSCHNRVSQHGIKFQLEIFKTESRGWGVRSLNSIPSGSFICEYIGELLEDKEAEQRTGNDEYLFDIGQNCNDHTLWDGLSNLMPDTHTSSCEVVEDGGFTIDAVQYGNIGRFINHSCSPNLYAQNVLYDHEDRRMPHIMLFSAENIPPLQELTYHYNYTIDQVRDSNGNIKKKSCYCGSLECTGRMY